MIVYYPARERAAYPEIYRNPIYTRAASTDPYAIMAPFRHTTVCLVLALLFRSYSFAFSKNILIAGERDDSNASIYTCAITSDGDEPRRVVRTACEQLEPRVWTWKYLFDPFSKKFHLHELHRDYTILPFRFFGPVPAPTRFDDRYCIHVYTCAHENCNRDAVGLHDAVVY